MNKPMLGIGFIRLLLAITVIITHTSPIFGFTLGNPVIAVRAFFIISGFYMALVLSEKYKSYWLFISNRFLKIYPIYWVTLILTLLLGVFLIVWRGYSYSILEYYEKYFKNLNFLSLLSLIIAQITIFGRNIIMFSGFDSQGGNFIWNFKMVYTTPSFPFLLVSQAWTLSLELMFYLIAPLLVKLKTRLIVFLVIFFILLRFFGRQIGMIGYYYDYMFFPFEIVFFILGILSYRIYVLIKNNDINKTMGRFFFVLQVFFLIFFQYIKLDGRILECLFYSVCVLTIPFIFNMSKMSVIDRKIGEYSYPVYIVHGLVGTVMYASFFTRHVKNMNYASLFSLGLSLVFSFLLIKYVQVPIEMLRIKRLKNERS